MALEETQRDGSLLEQVPFPQLLMAQVALCALIFSCLLRARAMPETGRVPGWAGLEEHLVPLPLEGARKLASWCPFSASLLLSEIFLCLPDTSDMGQVQPQGRGEER